MLPEFWNYIIHHKNLYLDMGTDLVDVYPQKKATASSRLVLLGTAARDYRNRRLV